MSSSSYFSLFFCNADLSCSPDLQANLLCYRRAILLHFPCSNELDQLIGHKERAAEAFAVDADSNRIDKEGKRFFAVGEYSNILDAHNFWFLPILLFKRGELLANRLTGGYKQWFEAGVDDVIRGERRG